MTTPLGDPVRVVVLDDYQRIASRIVDWGDLDVSFVHEALTGDALTERLRGAGVVVAMRERTPFAAGVLALLPELKLLVTTGMRNASIDLEAAGAQGVTVCGTGTVASPPAELTWGLILALARQIPQEDAAIRRGEWQVGIGTALEGKALGVIGLGKLGSRVAAVGLAFGMEVLAWSPHLDPGRARGLGVEPVDLPDLLRRSDVVTLHLVLSDTTRGLLGAEELALMKPSAYVVNTARGPLINEAALVTALADGTIAGAGLDVFDTEPLPLDHPLRTSPRAVLTPHTGYVTEEGYQVMYGEAVEDIRAWLSGTPLRLLN